MSSVPNPNQCAIGADKQLLSADKIAFVFNPDDPTPLTPASEDEIMAQEKRNNNNQLKTKFLTTKAKTHSTRRCKIKASSSSKLGEEEGTDMDDEDYMEDTASVFESEDEEESTAILSPLRSTNKIFLFYKKVSCNEDGTIKPDTKCYKCHHWKGTSQTHKVMKKMKHSTGHMIRYLKASSPLMYQLYDILKNCTAPPTNQEKVIASMTSNLSNAEIQEFVGRLVGLQKQTITQAFKRQSMAEWNQERFETLLAKCIEKPKFCELLWYIHQKALKIPKHTTIHCCVIDMGKKTIENAAEIFSTLKSKVAISLNAWTSSNQHAFLAIVTHYVTNDSILEERLINFCKLKGANTGENLAEAVLKTLKTYGPIGKIIALVMDNTTNNNTLVQSLKVHFMAAGIPFSATNAHMQCIPHIIHPTALQPLKGIGEGTEAAEEEGGDGGSDNADKDKDTSSAGGLTAALGNLLVVTKLHKIIKAICLSPQCQELWLKIVAMIDTSLKPLMLILDVHTHWSSTCDMLERALQFCSSIDHFTATNKDFQSWELTLKDWDTIQTVCDWLAAFKSATWEMSTTKVPVLSKAVAVFQGLQDNLKSALHTIPSTVSPNIKMVFVNTHNKLAEYYSKFDDSPYSIWAIHKSILNPAILYEGLKSMFTDNLSLLDNLRIKKSELEAHYAECYALNVSHAPDRPPLDTSASNTSKHTFDFTAAFHCAPRAVSNKLEAYFKMPAKDFGTCDPVNWWFVHRFQFPNLFQLVFDILGIPASAVAVEYNFSGGYDTISLHRASLQPKTIKILMILKQKICAHRASRNAGPQV